MSYTPPAENSINFNLIGQYLIPDGDAVNFDLKEAAKQVFIDIPLNIGTNVLDIYYDGCYILVCTDQGVEYLNSRAFESIWYFSSTIVQSVCSNQIKVCFGTVSSGFYYKDVPKIIGNLGNNFLAGCNIIDNLTSSGITDICVTELGFFVGGEGGVDSVINHGVDELKTDCQLTCFGVNSVAYSVNTETYYWSTVNKAYCADTCVEV
jgi:hypothetical protein